MDDFFSKIKSGAGKMAFEAEKLNNIAHAKIELSNLKEQVQGLMISLGEAYYDFKATRGASESDLDGLLQGIKDLKQQIKDKNAEIKRLDEEEYVPGEDAARSATIPPAVPAAAKFCPNCGAKVAPGAKFCPDCGTGLQ